MPEHPPLPLGSPRIGERDTGGRRKFPRLGGPGAERQGERLEPSFTRLSEAFEQERLVLAEDPGALEPERVIVLEVGGELDDFARAVREIDGLEFLADQVEGMIEPSEDFAVTVGDRVKPVRRQLFLVAGDQKAWKQTLSLWERFRRGEEMPHRLTKFRDVFERLHVLREWEDRDRLERTGVLEVWERELEGVADEVLVTFEAEFWFRKQAQSRKAAEKRLRRDLKAAGGELLDEAVLAEIGYHGVLANAPAGRLREVLADHEVRWLSTQGVRFFHAVGQIATSEPPDVEASEAPAEEVETEQETPLPTGASQIALLDGVPLANHSRLAGRIALDDPEDWEESTQSSDVCMRPARPL